MSKFINRKNRRKPLTRDQVLDLLKLGKEGNDGIVEEYIFRFGETFRTQKAHSICGHKYDHSFICILKDKLLK
jgi:hypothetical protein